MADDLDKETQEYLKRTRRTPGDFDPDFLIRKAKENPGGKTVTAETLLGKLAAEDSRELGQQRGQRRYALRIGKQVREQRATAWKDWMKKEALSLWSGPPSRNRMSIQKVAQELVDRWEEEYKKRTNPDTSPYCARHACFGSRPVSLGTALNYLKTVHADLTR